MNKIKVILIILVFFIASGTSFAQFIRFGKVFIGGGFGGFLSTHSHFSEVYKSNFGEDYFGQIGASVSPKTFLSAKLTYFHKTGVPVLKLSPLINGQHSGTAGGNADFKQWIINAGFIYNFPLFEGLDASINGGAFYAFIKENQTTANGATLIDLSTKSLGLYLGGGIEYHIPEMPFSVFAETQYNLASQLSTIGSATNYGGLNLNLGARIYIDTGL